MLKKTSIRAALTVFTVRSASGAAAFHPGVKDIKRTQRPASSIMYC